MLEKLTQTTKGRIKVRAEIQKREINGTTETRISHPEARFYKHAGIMLLFYASSRHAS
jgi:hypothetical protein